MKRGCKISLYLYKRIIRQHVIRFDSIIQIKGKKTHLKYSFLKRLGAAALLCLFLTPLVTAEWHRLALKSEASSCVHPPRDTKEGNLRPGYSQSHEVHGCALCDFSFSQVLLPAFSISFSQPRQPEPRLVSRIPTGHPDSGFFNQSGRGPPQA